MSRKDRGTSLVEVLISLVVIGAIGASMVMIVSVTLRNEAASTRNFDTTRSLQQISAYLPYDVAAAIPTSLDSDPARASQCPGSGGGTNVLAMTWTELFPTGSVATLFDASYRMQTIDGKATLVRITCSGTPLGNTKAVKITDRFADVATPVEATVNGGYVVFTILTDTGRTLQLSATSSSPTEGLDDGDEEDGE